MPISAFGSPPTAQSLWESRWVLWPDFRLPKDRDDALEVLREA